MDSCLIKGFDKDFFVGQARSSWGAIPIFETFNGDTKSVLIFTDTILAVNDDADCVKIGTLWKTAHLRLSKDRASKLMRCFDFKHEGTSIDFHDRLTQQPCLSLHLKLHSCALLNRKLWSLGWNYLSLTIGTQLSYWKSDGTCIDRVIVFIVRLNHSIQLIESQHAWGKLVSQVAYPQNDRISFKKLTRICNSDRVDVAGICVTDKLGIKARTCDFVVDGAFNFLTRFLDVKDWCG